MNHIKLFLARLVFFFHVSSSPILASPHECFSLRGYKLLILEKGLLRCLMLLPGTELKGLVHQCDCIVSVQSVHASHGSRFRYKARGNHRSTPFTRKATNEIDEKEKENKSNNNINNEKEKQQQAALNSRFLV